MRHQVREKQDGPGHQGGAWANRAIWIRGQIDIVNAMIHATSIKDP